MSESSIIGTAEFDGNFINIRHRIGSDGIKSLFLDFLAKYGVEDDFFVACRKRNQTRPPHNRGILAENRIEFENFHNKNCSRAQYWIDSFNWLDSGRPRGEYDWSELNRRWMDLFIEDYDYIAQGDALNVGCFHYPYETLWGDGTNPPQMPEPTPPCTMDWSGVAGDWVVSAATGTTLNSSIYADGVRYSTAHGSAPARIVQSEPSIITSDDFDYDSLFDELTVSGEGEGGTDE